MEAHGIGVLTPLDMPGNVPGQRSTWHLLISDSLLASGAYFCTFNANYAGQRRSVIATKEQWRMVRRMRALRERLIAISRDGLKI